MRITKEALALAQDAFQKADTARCGDPLTAAIEAIPEPEAEYEIRADVEDVSGYTITEADRRFAKDLGFVAPEVLPLHIARFREQNCKPPKQAPRFQVTLDEWAVAWAQWDRKNDKVPLFDALNKELARRPAEPAPSITREHYDTAYQRAVDASVRDEAAVKDALYRELGWGVPAPRALPTYDEVWTALEARQRAGGWEGIHEQTRYVLSLFREHASPADEALRSQFARLCSELNEKASRIERAERERDALRQELAEVTGQAEQVDGDLALLRRERDDALQKVTELTAAIETGPDDLDYEALRAQVKTLDLMLTATRETVVSVERERDEARAQLEEANAANDRDFALVQEECRELRSKLAARPEPVVIDEALAERVTIAIQEDKSDTWSRSVYRALRSVLGEKVSVWGSQFMGMDWAKAYDARTEECDKLRAELQLAHEQWREQHEELCGVFKQHEALRAGVEHIATWCVQSSATDHIAVQLRALLKPATPEAHDTGAVAETRPEELAKMSPFRSEALAQAVRIAERDVYVPPQYRTEGVPASLAPLTARVERLEAALRTFVAAWHGESSPIVYAVKEALTMLDVGKGE
jgi:hypothetical protein